MGTLPDAQLYEAFYNKQLVVTSEGKFKGADE